MRFRYLFLALLVWGLFTAHMAHADIPNSRDYIASAKAMEWKYVLPRHLLVAVCEQESSWNRYAESGKGALGICQIMPGTFILLVRLFQRTNGLEVDGVIGPKTWEAWRPGIPYRGMTNRERLLDPYQNVEWAAFYLKWIETNVSADPSLMMGIYYGGERHKMVRYQLEVTERREKYAKN